MPEAITNTSPLLYLYRIDCLGWLPKLFDEIWVPNAVNDELSEGQHRGCDVPIPANYAWWLIVNPTSVPSEWLTLDLGMGEMETMALALENPDRVVLLDDAVARRIANAAGLSVWGTLRILMEAKNVGIIEQIEPQVDLLQEAGMWISDNIRQRILYLAGE